MKFRRWRKAALSTNMTMLMLLNGVMYGSHRNRSIPLQTLLLVRMNVPDQGLVLMSQIQKRRRFPEVFSPCRWSPSLNCLLQSCCNGVVLLHITLELNHVAETVWLISNVSLLMQHSSPPEVASVARYRGA